MPAISQIATRARRSLMRRIRCHRLEQYTDEILEGGFIDHDRIAEGLLPGYIDDDRSAEGSDNLAINDLFPSDKDNWLADISDL